MSLWENEESISRVLQLIVRMNHVTLFREVTEAHILAYRYRTDLDIFGDYTPEDQDNHVSLLDGFLNKAMVSIINGIRVSMPSGYASGLECAW